MKKYYIVLPVMICAFWLALSAYSQSPSQTVEPEEHFPRLSVAPPELPGKLEFAGERVPLENFDTRESLRRELLVTTNMHSRTTLTLLNTHRYFPVIEPILARSGVPEDFKYLCMAESGLDPEAVSSAGAGGLWQIMKGTGKEYGLEVSAEIDERFHLEKATEAACKYLLESYERFGSWTLAAAAYNAGKAGIDRRLTKQGTDNYYDTFLPQETLRYIFRILSLKIVTENPSEYGFDIAREDYYAPLTNWSQAEVSGKPIDWAAFARDNGTNYKMLRLLNPWIRDYDYSNRQDKVWTVKLPGDNFREALAATDNETGKRRNRRNR